MGGIVTQDDIEGYVDEPKITSNDEEEEITWELDKEFGSDYDPSNNYSKNNECFLEFWRDIEKIIEANVILTVMSNMIDERRMQNEERNR